ncbi:hypothetical protein DICPUDRAFT_91041 [Dictyostelium purpureum]|uniref:Choline transporter-like protein n=1 Tax=Dictyostelium purpureum TaxID=5786 RepID=F0Z6R5_DICPU|nr:uncharacterized protein DICPUDRAFT_91041 [Dictyostelium purpureum]EGC40408.1 hypothetical protein DICPUDRAFT_91041 [Dictyostelium purpureum]|eukprot:XP_003283159.1 hypothetical protein DICPUDRAFT_91041 [Dictyostelium purpureum]
MKVLFLFFNMYWTQYVIIYICYSTSSGLFAAWYFFANEDFSNMPPNPCLSSFSRAMTTSFGSIALGSLIVCAITTLEMLCRMFARLPGLRFFFNLLANILCCFNRILFTFNVYSFSMVAIYGESYCTSARKTFTLMTNNPTKLTVAHNFMYITTLAISLSISFIVVFIVVMILSALKINEIWLNSQIILLVLIIWKPFDVIFSGVITTVMCLISEPLVLQNNKPNIFYDLNQIDFN